MAWGRERLNHSLPKGAILPPINRVEPKKNLALLEDILLHLGLSLVRPHLDGGQPFQVSKTMTFRPVSGSSPSGVDRRASFWGGEGVECPSQEERVLAEKEMTFCLPCGPPGEKLRAGEYWQRKKRDAVLPLGG